MHFASPASPKDYLDHPLDTLRVGSDGTFNTLDLAMAKGARYHGGVHERGVRRAAGEPAARELLGQREPQRSAQRVRRGEAVRRGGHRVVPPIARASTPRSSASSTPTARGCGPRTAGSCRTSSSRRCSAGRSRSTATAARPAASGTSSDIVAGNDRAARQRPRRPGQHRQPRRVHDDRAGRAGARTDRFDVGDLVRAAARRTIRPSVAPTSPWLADDLGWEPTTSLRDGLVPTIDYFRRALASR